MMSYSFSPRDKANRATLTINGRKSEECTFVMATHGLTHIKQAG